MERLRRLEPIGIAAGVMLLVVVPTAVHGWPTSLSGNLFVLCLVGGGLALTGWRSHAGVVSVTALGLFLAAFALEGWFPDPALALFSFSFALLALGWSGRAAWLVALCAAAYLVPVFLLNGAGSWVAVLMFTVPPYVAGTLLRLRQETAEELALRAQELDDERELFTEIALRQERARIASELHDIVGHAISVMVVQAAAGQRLVDVDPERAKEAFAAIAESARQGTHDLGRLVELLSGTEVGPGGFPTSRWSTRWSPAPAAAVSTSPAGSRATVNGSLARRAAGLPCGAGESHERAQVRTGRGGAHPDQPRRRRPWPSCARGERRRCHERRAAVGTGTGLVGLRERIQALGGRFNAGATGVGGWAVEARLPAG